MSVSARDVCEADPRAPVGKQPGAVGSHENGPRTNGPRRPRASWTLCSYLGKGAGLNCLLAFLILEAVQGVIFTVRATEDYSFDILIIFPILVRAFLQAVTYSLPLSLLFGTSLLVGRLNADRELLALRSFGVSPLQMSLPVLGLGSLLTLGAYVLNSEWAPAMRYANRNAETLVLENLGYLGEGWNFQPPINSMNLWIRHYDGPVLEDMFVGIGKADKLLLVSADAGKTVHAPSYAQYLFAKRGLVARGKGQQSGQVVLDLQQVSLFVDQGCFDAALRSYESTEGIASDAPRAETAASPDPADPAAPGGVSLRFMQRAYFERLQWAIKTDQRDKTVKDMSGSELWKEIRERDDRLSKARTVGDSKQTDYAVGQYWYAVTELHRRVSISLATLLFPLCAFLIGLSISSANRLLPFFVAAMTVPTLYFSGEMLGNYLGKRGIVPIVTEEIGNLALCAVSAALLVRLYRKPGR